VHDFKIGGANYQAPPNEIHELYPSIANEQERPRVAHLQQIPGHGNFGEGPDAAVETDQQVGLREEA
jgi:hypothetical protein